MPKMPDLASLGSLISTEVKKFVGDPYVYGGAGPTNFDCSGLVQYTLTQLGVKNVPRTSEAQWSWSKRISHADLQPGDLVFSQWPGDGASPGHVAVYVGGGQIVEAPRPGEAVHQVPLNSYYQKFVTGYGRVPGVTASGGTGSTGAVPAGDTTVQQAGWLGDVGGWIGGLVSSGVGDVAGMLGTVFTPVGNVAKDLSSALSTTMHAILWLVNPANWVRIIAGVIGGLAVLAGAFLVASSA